jgi:hypothetical protein
VSATSKPDRPLSQLQFALIASVLALSAVLALVVLANVAGKHGKCPSQTQVSRPGASSCFAAYKNTPNTGIVG